MTTENKPIYILCIETSTNVCSVALSRNGEVLTLQETNEFKSHSEKITIFIQECLDEAGIGFSDISAIAISKGPGSYTGLRIGASTAKGLCMALDIPLIAIGSLDVLRDGVKEELDEQDAILTAIDARRSEIYGKLFLKEDILIETSAIILNEENILQSKIDECSEVYVIGNGSEKCIELLKGNLIEVNSKTSASYMCALSHHYFLEKQFEDLVSFSPFYLKNPNITKRSKKLLF